MRDWQEVLALAVACRTCTAGVGEQCWHLEERARRGVGAAVDLAEGGRRGNA